MIEFPIRKRATKVRVDLSFMKTLNAKYPNALSFPERTRRFMEDYQKNMKTLEALLYGKK